MKQYAIAIVIALLFTACSEDDKASKTNQPAIKVEKKVETLKPVVKDELVEEVKTAYEMKSVHFDFDQYALATKDRGILSQHARYLNENKNVKILIEGHCDERGTTEYNLALGEKRAQTVKNYLMNAGVSADRLKTISFGKEKPVDDRSNEDAWAKNRRAEFKTVR